MQRTTHDSRLALWIIFKHIVEAKALKMEQRKQAQDAEVGSYSPPRGRRPSVTTGPVQQQQCDTHSGRGALTVSDDDVEAERAAAAFQINTLLLLSLI